ncbi:dihydrolipoamide dehydrogenase [Parvibaculum indicum]|uniref:dihydrolipoyl dehydrogenase n=1 Tax=Parvibaculum indicum TaxID=562969 RepID=UPI0014245E02|nr:dihydrolipoyl dehydrogenase [Parvibaculum indicum]NIJ42758.1 dihydrolipoamide dehydrogenase [Parvibaculum indicum]
MSEKNYDLVILGSGPGGYVAAVRAAQLGMKTAIVERDKLGGICLNWGCIPTKALLRSAEVYDLIERAQEFGLKVEKPTYDAAAVVKRSRDVSERLSRGVGFLMKKNKIDVIEGTGALAGEGKIAVDGKDGKQTLTAKNIILATGARARTLPGLEPDGKLVWTYREAMVPEAMPKSLLVIGSGAIGIEFASFYRAFGCEVTVVEVMDRILPVEDEEISKMAARAFKKRGMKIMTGAKVEKLDKQKDSVKATIANAQGKSETIEVERVISAVGIDGNVEDIGLEEAGIKVEKGHVVVDEWLRTGVKGVYAIGDLVGAPWLAHKAMHEGVIAVEHMAGVKGLHPLDTKKVPGCTYSAPQIASVGLTEAQATEQGHKVKVGRFPFTGNGKAIALGEDQGLIKTIFDEKTGELLGAHMIGAEVTELIQGYTVAKNLETTEAELMHTIFPHPTLSEMMHESVLDAYQKALHI